MKRFFIIAGALAISAMGIHAAEDVPASPATTPSPDAANQRMAAYREAKFGMFIHWGLYAIPASGEWHMNSAKMPVAKYAQFAPRFNPVKFNAEEWVRVAKDAGMKYIVITAKHHDGFAMFDSKVSPFNIVAATPFKRDPMKELADACRKAGLGFGFYYSHSQDWHHPGGAVWGGKKWDAAQQGDFAKYLKELAIPQVRELMTHYGPVFVLWFDTPWEITADSGRQFVEAVHAAQPATYINSRLMYGGYRIPGLTRAELDEMREVGIDYLSYRDKSIPAVPQWRDWETCMTLNDSWGYTKNTNWKSPAVLIGQLVEIASKGGNFLLNVGPDAQGVIPAASVKNLKAVGEWLKINGEAIYGAGPSPFPRRALAADAGKQAWYCTTKPGKLYIHLFKWPQGKFELAGVTEKVTNAHLLSDRGSALPVTQVDGKLTVQLPATAPNPIATVLCLEHN
jgi:alpha-L-fucosidase